MTSWQQHKENLNTVIKQMTEKGEKDINQVLDMPFNFLMQEIYTPKKKGAKQGGSIMAAFGGTDPDQK